MITPPLWLVPMIVETIPPESLPRLESRPHPVQLPRVRRRVRLHRRQLAPGLRRRVDAAGFVDGRVDERVSGGVARLVVQEARIARGDLPSQHVINEER